MPRFRRVESSRGLGGRKERTDDDCPETLQRPWDGGRHRHVVRAYRACADTVAASLP